MGSNNKKTKHKDRDSRKRRHRSRSSSVENVRENLRENEKHRHHHKRHHKEKKHKRNEYENNDSDIGIPSPPRIQKSCTPPPPPTITIKDDSSPERESTSSKGGAGADCLSIDETNKLRAKLGLKPLQVESDQKASADGKKKDDLGEFYHKPAVNIATKAYEEKIRTKLNERKEKRSVESKLKRVKTLGESDSDDDVESWIEKNRRIQKEKEEAAKRAKMLEELDQELGVGQLVETATREQKQKAYTQSHLKGLRVEHDAEDFAEGGLAILTLKDQAILEDTEDVLVNVNMVDNERYRKNIDRKKYTGYNPYENADDFDEFGIPKPKDLLGKYDEEIDGEKKRSFAIGEEDLVERRRLSTLAVKAKLEHKRLETLILPEPKLASEYYSEEELTKFKKPKKKVRKIREKAKSLKPEDLLSGQNNDYLKDLGSRRKKESLNSKTFIETDDTPHFDFKPEEMKLESDDSELELALHKARKLKAMETREALPPIAPIKWEPVDEEMGSEDAGNIILNSTAEFCRTLGDIPTYGRAGNRDEEEDLLDFDNDVEDYKPAEMDDSSGPVGSWNTVETDFKNGTNPRPDIGPTETPILDEEPDVGSGVAAALQLAMSKGYLDKEDTNRPSTSRLAHLQAKNYSIEDKAHVDDEKFGRRDRYAGPIMEFKEKDTFKPNVKLDYIDDEGHVLNSKEAFRYLSHKFHGKGPGKNKIEKRIKKNEQEGLMKKMSSTDTPLGTLNMLQAKQKETHSPYIVLSGSKHTHSTTISKMK